MRILKLLPTLLAAVCLTAPLAAQANDDAAKLAEQLKPVFTHASLESGDYDAWVSQLLSLIEKDPAADASVVAMARIGRRLDELATSRPVYAMLERLRAGNFAACGDAADDYAALWLRLARRYSTDLAWQEQRKPWMGITTASYIGPFAEGGGTIHDDAFSPEAMLDFSARATGPWGGLAWQTVRHHDPQDDEIDLYEQARWSGYGYYVATVLVSDAARDVTLKLAFHGPGKVWLNGEYLFNADARRHELPQPLELPASLRRGRNVLLLKISGISQVSIRVRQGGLPVQGVLAQAPAATEARQAIRAGTPKLAAASLPRLERVEALAANATGETRALLCLAAAVLSESGTLRTRAALHAESAAAAAPESALIQLEFLRMLEYSPLHTSSSRRALRQQITTSLLASQPALYGAVRERAKQLAADEQPAEAINTLRAMREAGHDSWRLCLLMAEVYRQENWTAEYSAELRRAHGLNPKSEPVLDDLASSHGSRGDMAGEMRVLHELLALVPGDRETMWSLMNLNVRSGNNADALKFARRIALQAPGDHFVRRKLAEVLAANGQLKEARTELESISAQSPHPEEALYDAARLCLRHGDEAAATRYLQQVLAVDDGQHAARRQLQRLKGESDEFWHGLALPLEAVWDYDVEPEQFPRAASVLLLDEMVQVVYADGSSLSYVHTLRKILTQDGVDERGRDRIPGELLVARTIRPDGTVLEPITQGGGVVEFPAVEVGCFLETAYVLRADGRPSQTLDGDRFYFMDTNLAEPFCISRWVVHAPQSVRIDFMPHNLRADDPGVTISQSSDKGFNTWVFDVRNPRHPEYEVLMPSPLEFIPWVQCIVAHDWRDKGRELADDALPLLRTTPLIEETARRLTAGITADVDKARAIYAWVNENFTTEGDAYNAHQALASMAGDREQVFIALCSAAGVKLGFALADASPRYKQALAEDTPRAHWAFPREQDFEHRLCFVRDAQNRRVWINLDRRLRPFGMLSSRLFEAPFIAWEDGRTELGMLPGGDPEDDRFENRATVALNDDGSAEVKGSITIFGERSYDQKEAMRTQPYEDQCTALEEEVAGLLPGFEVSVCRFPDLGSPDKPLVQGFEGTVRQLASRQGDTMTMELPIERMGPLLSILAGLDKRDHDIVLDFNLHQHDELRLAPPPGWSFAALPEGLEYPTAPLTYSLSFTIEDGEMVVRRKLALGPGRLKPFAYPELVEQVKRIKAAEEVKLKLVKQP